MTSSAVLSISRGGGALNAEDGRTRDGDERARTVRRG